MQVLPNGEWVKPPRPPALSVHGAIALTSWRICGPHIERLPVYAAIYRVLDYELNVELWCEISAIESEKD